ncbi:glycosyltransferase [Pseudomonas stutzeri]|uniref:glycosyltransferase n=1 Tax=Stutzerimonas stutzeri TaxID=316 RepID=UPI0021099C77|nr:glycosyltransferase [Stutzerimonas stutzeri]
MTGPSGETSAPLLSVVVLVYNTAEYLRACFDSLLNQACQDVEIIAIDDASTDDSLAICREYERTRSNFRCISKANEGGAVAANLGISLARGRYLALVDSDDVVTPQGYARLIERAETTGADIVVGRAMRLVGDVLTTEGFAYEPFAWSRPRVIHTPAALDDLMHDGFYWNKVFRTGFLREHGLGMEPGLLYADRPFVHRAYWLSRCTVVEGHVVYLWRQRPAGDSITQRKAQVGNFRDRVRSARLEWTQYADEPLAQQYRRAIALSNLQRALQVAPEALVSEVFCEAFIEGMSELIADFGPLDLAPVGVRRSTYLTLIHQGHVSALKHLLQTPNDCRVEQRDGATHWAPAALASPPAGFDSSALQIEIPTLGFFALARVSVEGGQLRMTLDLPADVQQRADVCLTLWSFGSGEELPFTLYESGSRDQRFALPCRVIDEWIGRQHDGPFGLALRYRYRGQIARYRLGRSLIDPAVIAQLPVAISSALQLELTPETGALTVTTHP